MFRIITAFILLAAFSAQTFQRAWIVLDYYTNTSSFLANCENISRPVLHCDGKCQMVKKIKQEEKKSQQNPERKMENKNEVISSRSFFTTLEYKIPPSKSIAFSFYKAGRLTRRPSAIFHPPCLV
jgi:hypothetical protein